LEEREEEREGEWALRAMAITEPAAGYIPLPNHI
jgi:hypothetical protein